MRALALASALLMGAAAADAKEVVSVSGEATYYDDGTRSRIECMRLAAEQARIKALADEFGTVVTQNVMLTDRVGDNGQHSDFLNLSTSEVRGEWLGDDGEPEYKISFDPNGNFIVYCKVRGKASAISNEAPEFESLVLRNSPEKQAAETHFRDGDTMYMYFNSAADGFLTIFLQDEQDNTYQLLPYTSDPKTRVPVRGKHEYIFFCQDKRDGHIGEIDEFTLTAPDHVEYNRVYVVFSPKYFNTPVMTREPGAPAVMSSKDFTKWLAKARRNDSSMGVNTMTLEIVPK